MSSKDSLSRKEQEVIAQQRKLAALLSMRSNSGDATSTNVASAVKPSEPKKPTKTSASMPQKRPTRPGLKRPTVASASSVLAEARAKAAAKKDPDNAKKSEAKAEKDATGQESQQVEQKATCKAREHHRLENLVKSVAATSTGAGDDTLASFGSTVTPADFWKNMREWDFVKDLALINNDNNKDESVPPVKRKSIPETFISFRHYISLWAPLCLAEARAQLISERMTSSNSPSSRANLFFQVEVETTWKSGGGRKDRSLQLHTDMTDIDSCSVVLGTKERNRGDGQIFANDVFCLIPVENKDTIELLLNGKKVADHSGTFKNFAIVGHTEVQRKDINGLILKVSKRKWAQIGTSRMYLLKIGANITALREFTALCGVETIPLKRYLLGHHLTEKSKVGGSSHAQVATISDTTSTETILKQMGGVQALGKGFTDYARKKFNPSQLMAISASSAGYGEGESCGRKGAFLLLF